MKSSYAAKLRDPRWQKKRLEIFKRDSFTCQLCWETQRELHCHHLFYEPGREPWEADDSDLLTTCVVCHKEAEARKKALLSLLRSPTNGVIIDAVIELHRRDPKELQNLLCEKLYQETSVPVLPG